MILAFIIESQYPDDLFTCLQKFSANGKMRLDEALLARHKHGS